MVAYDTSSGKALPWQCQFCHRLKTLLFHQAYGQHLLCYHGFLGHKNVHFINLRISSVPGLLTLPQLSHIFASAQQTSLHQFALGVPDPSSKSGTCPANLDSVFTGRSSLIRASRVIKVFYFPYYVLHFCFVCVLVTLTCDKIDCAFLASWYTRVLQDRHLSETSLRLAYEHRKKSDSSAQLPPQPPPPPIYPPNAALQAIRRFTCKPPFPELMVWINFYTLLLSKSNQSLWYSLSHHQNLFASSNECMRSVLGGYWLSHQTKTLEPFSLLFTAIIHRLPYNYYDISAV